MRATAPRRPSAEAPEAAEAARGAAAPPPARCLDEVRHAFFQLEARLGLFERTAGGCPLWDYLRVEVFDAVSAALGLLGEKQEPVDRRARAHARQLPRIARSLVMRNPFLQRPVDVLVLAHPRRRLEPDRRWWDPCTDPLLEALDLPFLVVERPFHLRHREPARASRIAHLDALALGAALLRRVQCDPLGPGDTAFLDRVAHELRRELGAAVPVPALARAKLMLRQSQLPLWRALLRHLRPRVVLLVVSYGNEIPIEACREFGIPTVELQHGVISEHNLGYHFPVPGCTKRLFPDWLFTFGPFWGDAARFPIAGERIVPVGFRWLEQRRAALAGVRKRRQVVFVSQRSIGAALSRLAVDVATSAGFDGEVVYKLHPGERTTWRADYPWLHGAPLRIADGDAPSLYELLAPARLQVGVYSTGLFEGLAFDCATRIARLPGCDAMRGLVGATPAVDWVDDAAGVLRALDAPPPEAAQLDVARFFRPNAADNLRAALAAVLARG